MGRHRVPPDIQRLKGNPRKVKIERGAGAARPQAEPEVLPPDKAPALADIVPPEHLDERERAIFMSIVSEFLPRNLVRVTDFNAVAIVATWMNKWIEAKLTLREAGTDYQLVRSKHVPDGLIRSHPAFKHLSQADDHLFRWMPQLGLTPLSRNAIMSRFMKGAGSGAGPMFDQPQQPGADDESESAEQMSALGFLERAQTAGEA